MSDAALAQHVLVHAGWLACDVLQDEQPGGAIVHAPYRCPPGPGPAGAFAGLFRSDLRHRRVDRHGVDRDRGVASESFASSPLSGAPTPWLVGGVAHHDRAGADPRVFRDHFRGLRADTIFATYFVPRRPRRPAESRCPLVFDLAAVGYRPGFGRPSVVPHIRASDRTRIAATCRRVRGAGGHIDGRSRTDIGDRRTDGATRMTAYPGGVERGGPVRRLPASAVPGPIGPRRTCSSVTTSETTPRA